MRITVTIPSRGRAAMLQQAVASLCHRASGKHDLIVAIAADADDPQTVEAGHVMRYLRGLPVAVHCAVRQPSLGGLVNRLAEAHPADIYCSLGDDITVTSSNWDEAVADAWASRPDGVFWWKANTGSTFAIVSEKWRAAAGRIFTDYFPFWGDDIWLADVWRQASGLPLVGLYGATLDEQRPGTQRMRDLPLWTDFFWSRKGERTAEARRIAGRLGWPLVAQPLVSLEPNPLFLSRLAEVEANQGDKEPPTPEYMRAKTRIINLMAA